MGAAHPAMPASPPAPYPDTMLQQHQQAYPQPPAPSEGYPAAAAPPAPSGHSYSNPSQTYPSPAQNMMYDENYDRYIPFSSYIIL